MMVDRKRINRVINRIARGLYYIIQGYPVPYEHEIKCTFKDDSFSFPEDVIMRWQGLWTKPVMIGDNIFSYSYIHCVDDMKALLLIYWFYGKLYFYGYVLPLIKSKESQ